MTNWRILSRSSASMILKTSSKTMTTLFHEGAVVWTPSALNANSICRAELQHCRLSCSNAHRSEDVMD